MEMAGKIKWTYQKVKEYIQENNCILLSSNSSYQDGRSVLEIKCHCGETFSATFNKFKLKKKKQCGSCNGQSKWHFQRVKQFIESNSECILLSEEYKGCDEKLLLKCYCGNEFQVRLTHFRGTPSRIGQRQCSSCGIKNHQKKMTKPYTLIREEIESHDCILLTSEKEYKGTQQKAEARCKCGDVFYCSPNTMKMYNRYCCIKCSKKPRLSKKEVIEWLKENAQGFEFLSDNYKGVNYKYNMKCPNGHIFSKKFSHFYHGGNRCPTCVSSLGESAIADYLIRNKIKHEPQYWFSDCKRVQVLHFDFAVFKEEKLNCLIEFDGRQHFEPVDFGSMNKEDTLEKLRATQLNDRIKNDYCKKNHIKLIRIPYWEFSKIDEILSKHL